MAAFSFAYRDPLVDGLFLRVEHHIPIEIDHEHSPPN